MRQTAILSTNRVVLPTTVINIGYASVVERPGLHQLDFVVMRDSTADIIDQLESRRRVTIGGAVDVFSSPTVRRDSHVYWTI